MHHLVKHERKCEFKGHQLFSLSPYSLHRLDVFIPGAPPPQKKTPGDSVNFSGLCSYEQLSFSPCWIEHLLLITITPRSLNLVENFLFYE